MCHTLRRGRRRPLWRFEPELGVAYRQTAAGGLGIVLPGPAVSSHAAIAQGIERDA